jgi:hypothetical protein
VTRDKTRRESYHAAHEYHEIEREKSPGAPREVGHEVDNERKDQNLRGGESLVDKDLGCPERRRPVKRICLVFVHNWSACHGSSELREGIEGIEKECDKYQSSPDRQVNHHQPSTALLCRTLTC